ncbi:stage V sporulation protein AE [Brevibacillus laterosporus]|uniref:Stage V sporulation protein AE1 n=1 Tax=Brevibacillus laterosporus LMG 15441 TaxID=1042163 RepID=A0A075R3M6_BRELA|nr:stage V sporulation protein AE [Brevibacillus laterosporus]AIG26086.1 stage V sporulation protein AE1 [Brevibacillus laterosporus LMG 15441]ERM20268.1 stage V sporulation protein AE [Brevibacillus laterosporus PE36]MDF9413931.1 stage V sporulation protein AE [Brevibacillus laterosporus]RJL07969.1 stage V sporulation protein AE [Brevibacillus laterosporus]TPH17904.1 stage V sporulation protein AE [Brevibacillus laterosporus]
MNQARRRVIIITDGDHIAQRVIEEVARQIGGRCISLSAGNPTLLSGEQMVTLIKQTPYDPVLVMFDDNGNYGFGRGERAICFVAKHPDIEVLGAVAVASNTKWVTGTKVKYSVTKQGIVVEDAVDKDGVVHKELQHRIYGDTVDILNACDITHIIGIGDIGKMDGRDHINKGCPITKKAIEWIMERSGYRVGG